jgi:major type 1 subunit fimbrin (pilin)
MKKTILTAALLTAVGVAAVAPQARAAGNTSAGTITITGSVVTSTCNVAVNGTSGNGTVTLPTVDTGTLSTTLSTAGWTSFPITLTGCGTSVSNGTTTYTKVFPYFTGTSVDSTSGYLDNTGTSNVQVALSNSAGTGSTAVKLNQPSGSQNITAQTLSASAITFTLYAGYVAQTAAATAGTVNTTVQYDLNYQ